MEITSLCLILFFLHIGPTHASLSVSPSRSQFFEYESVRLSCEEEEEEEEEEERSSTGWRVRRSTGGVWSECGDVWGKVKASSCTLEVVFTSNMADYWCESTSGEKSNTISIRVTAGAVILESPVLPVTEGDAVTLRCRYQTPPSNLTTDFYKDGSLIRTESTGEMTIPAVSKSDEGLYKCNNSDLGESPESWLAVRGVSPAPSTPPPPPAPIMSLSRLICHLVVASPYLLCTMILVKYHRSNQARTKEEKRSCDDVVMETSN